MGIKTVDQRFSANSKKHVFAKFSCKFLAFYSFLQLKMMKITISTSVWGAQHPNAGQNIQQLRVKFTKKKSTTSAKTSWHFSNVKFAQERKLIIVPLMNLILHLVLFFVKKRSSIFSVSFKTLLKVKKIII